MQDETDLAATLAPARAGVREPGGQARRGPGRVDLAGATEPDADLSIRRERIEGDRHRPVEDDPTEAVMQAGAHLDLLGGCAMRQVEHHDAPLEDVLAHGDARLQVEGELPSVRVETGTREEVIEASDRSVQDDFERPFEAQPISAALLPPRHRDRRRPLQHQTPEAIMKSGAHRYGLIAVCRKRKEHREHGQQNAEQAIASEPGVP